MTTWERGLGTGYPPYQIKAVDYSPVDFGQNSYWFEQGLDVINIIFCHAAKFSCVSVISFHCRLGVRFNEMASSASVSLELTTPNYNFRSTIQWFLWFLVSDQKDVTPFLRRNFGFNSRRSTLSFLGMPSEYVSWQAYLPCRSQRGHSIERLEIFVKLAVTSE